MLNRKGIIIKYCLLIILMIIVLTPIIFMIANSFMTAEEVSEYYGLKNGNRTKLIFIPDMVTLRQYYNVLLKTPQFLIKFWNSCRLVVPIVIGQVIICIPAAFAFSKFSFPFKKTLILMIIILILMPYQSTLVPNYIILDKLNLIGENSSIILPGLFSALGVFILTQFMKNIPQSQIEAAEIDGAGYFRILTKIVIPQCKGGIVSLVILSFADNWNMIEQPIIFLENINKYPLSVFLSKINNENLGIAFVCGVIYMIPAILLFLWGQKYLLDGMKNIEIK